MIKRFLNIVTNQGVDITYVDSATLGGSFTINTSGVYGISYSDSGTVVMSLGITLNSSQLTTAIASINIGDRLITSATAAANFDVAVSTIVYLAAGSVIRAHADANATGTRLALFTITRID